MSVADFIKNLVRTDEEEGYVEDYGAEEENNPEAYDEDSSQFSTGENLEHDRYSDRRYFSAKNKKPMKDNNVIEMRGMSNSNTEMMVIEPESFDDMPRVIDALRDRKSVVLNLEKMEPEKAQRSVDFVAGGTYAMDGHYERVGDNIFLFTPSCVTVSNLSGLISNADDFSSVRNRRPSMHQPINNPVEHWAEPNIAAQ